MKVTATPNPARMFFNTAGRCLKDLISSKPTSMGVTGDEPFPTITVTPSRETPYSRPFTFSPLKRTISTFAPSGVWVASTLGGTVAAQACGVRARAIQRLRNP